MPNILSKQEMLQAKPDGVTYVVWQGKDYFISLAALIALVTTTSLGLDKVDNTADKDKPISSAQQDALNLKADKDKVPTLDAFNLLSDSLQNYVTKAQLDALSQSITDALTSYATKDVLSATVNSAVQTLNSALSQLSQNLQGEIDALNNTTIPSLATKQGLSDAVTSLNQSIAQAAQTASQNLSGAVTNIDEQITAIQNQLQMALNAQVALQDALNGKADKVHMHSVDEITGLTAFVEGLISQNVNLNLGPNEW